jgi:cytoskeletal protein RodZ
VTVPNDRRAPRRDPGAERAVMVGVVVLAALVGTALVALGPDRSGSSDAVVVAASPESTTATATTTGASTAQPATSATAAPVTTTTAAKASKAAQGTAAVTTTTAPAPTTTVDPGTLPQTDEKPTASGAQFDAGAQALWQAIVTDDPSVALPFFFPESAYLQVKAISDPAGDYKNRLIANYEQDIHSLHAQLGGDAARARFTGVSVPGDQAVWVQPGAEYNKGSYWRVYGSTLDYTVDGEAHSFPVTSLISWRGQWYVVHLGEIR